MCNHIFNINLFDLLCIKDFLLLCHDICLQFSFLIYLVLYKSNAGVTQCVGNYYLLLNFLEEFIRVGIFLFLKYLVKHDTKIIWYWSFPYGKIFNY